MYHITAFFGLMLSLTVAITAQEVQDPTYPKILAMKDRAVIEDAWLEERLNTLVPKMMRKKWH